MLHLFWLTLILAGFCTALYRTIFQQEYALFGELVASLFEMSKLGFDIALGLTGVLCLWLGLFKVAEASGLTRIIAKGLEPLLTRLMPDVPRDHPAFGAITLNLGANVLGLDNTATPLGLKAMRALQTLNKTPDQASNPQILFLVLNTSSVTLLPITIFLYRAQQGSANPTEVFLPIILATSCSTLVGLLAVGWVQKLPLFNPIVMLYIGGYALFLSGTIYGLSSLDSEQLNLYSSLVGNLTIMSVVVLFLVSGLLKKLDTYELFIQGAKQGFAVAIRIVPYLIAMLVAIGVFRASGALDQILLMLKALLEPTQIDTRFVDALPTAFMKPLSGSGARAMMLESMHHFGVDSFVARLTAIMQGSTETTLYVLAVYFGSVGIRHVRHALACGLIADLGGIVSAIFIAYWFFG